VGGARVTGPFRMLVVQDDVDAAAGVPVAGCIDPLGVAE